jgi:glycine/D-amino acid oxidase-like deaminating enzyme
MYDVIIIGGGMVGAYCAYEFSRHKLKTVLLERERIAAGASGRGGGLLLKGATDVFSEEVVPHLVANQQLLEQFIQDNHAEVDYLRGGSLYVSFAEDWEFTREQVRTMNAAGLPAELWSAQELRKHLPRLTVNAAGGRFIPSDAQLSPPKLAAEFARIAQSTGAEIRINSAVTSLLRDSKKRVIGVQTSQETLYGGQIVLATNAYTAQLIPELRPIIIPTRGQAFLTHSFSSSFPFACASNYDLEYWRQTKDGNILFGGCRRFEEEAPNGAGTESVETTVAVQEALVRAFRSFFPTWNPQPLNRAWGGSMAFTPDFKPLIGPLPGYPNILIAAGFSGNGLPLVCTAGQMLREMILQGVPSFSSRPYEPGRFLPG